jgi:glycosyltransferase involved in cell wall biosynthesis
MRCLVAVTPSLGARFCQYNGVPLHKLRIAPYGANVEAPWRHSADEVAALRDRLRIQPDEVLIGSVGRLIEAKDYPTQFRAFALAARCLPRLRMVLAGDGPLRDSLHQLTRELGIEERVHFLGHWEEVPLLLRALEVFVLSSKFESYGVALLEAKAAGVAIAATRVHEVPEIIDDGRSGLLVPAESPESLAEVFVRLARDPDLRHRLGRQALQEAREQHSLQAMVRTYQELYDQVRES